MGALSKLIFGGEGEVRDGNNWISPEPASLELGMTKANFSNKNLGGGGAIIISAWMTHTDNGALTSLHVGRNKIPEKEMREIMAIAMRMDSMKILCEIPFKDKTVTELDASGKNLGSEGALVVAEYLDGNGALTRINMSKNTLATKEAGEALGNMLKANSVLTELDVSSNAIPHDGSGFAQGISKGLPDNEALTSLDISDNGLYAEGTKLLAEALKSNQIMTALNISSNEMTYAGVRYVGDEHFGDMSGVAALGDNMPGMGALTSLDISSNGIVSGTWMDPPRNDLKVGDMVDGNLISEIDEDDGQVYVVYLSGIKAVANAIKDMRAMTSLNLASNDIGGWFDEGDFVATPEGIHRTACPP
jgi:hypothetical protein